MRPLFAAAFLLLAALFTWQLRLLVQMQDERQEMQALLLQRKAVDRLARAWRDLNRPGNDVLSDWNHQRETTAFNRYLRVLDEAQAGLVATPGAGMPLAGFLQAFTAEREVMVGASRDIFQAVAEREALLARGADLEAVREREGRAARQMAAMDQSLQRGLDLVVAEGDRLANHVAAQVEGQRGSLVRVLVVLLSAVVVGALCLELLRRGYRTRVELKALTALIERIVRESDFTHPIPTGLHGNVARVAASFEHLVERLREIHGTLLESVQRLADTMGTLGPTADGQRELVQRTATGLQETRATAEELQATAALAAERARSVLEVAQRADTLGQEGERAVEATLSGLEAIRGQAAQTGERIRRLAEQARRIESITATVKAVADQSHMLALNAAVEATRSGERGKGFGVVAREMRALADQSLRATEQVRGLLQQVQTSIHEVTDLTARGEQRLPEDLAQARSSGEVLRKLALIVQDNVEAAQQIAGAASQQREGAGQLFDAVHEQAAAMARASALVERSTEAMGELQAVSERLQLLVSSYRV